MAVGVSLTTKLQRGVTQKFAGVISPVGCRDADLFQCIARYCDKTLYVLDVSVCVCAIEACPKYTCMRRASMH